MSGSVVQLLIADHTTFITSVCLTLMSWGSFCFFERKLFSILAIKDDDGQGGGGGDDDDIDDDDDDVRMHSEKLWKLICVAASKTVPR